MISVAPGRIRLVLHLLIESPVTHPSTELSMRAYTPAEVLLLVLPTYQRHFTGAGGQA